MTDEKTIEVFFGGLRVVFKESETAVVSVYGAGGGGGSGKRADDAPTVEPPAEEPAQ